MRVVHNMQGMSARSPANSGRVTSKMAALIELGGFNLAKLMHEYAAAESHIINAADYVAQGGWPGMRSAVLENMRSLLFFLQGLPVAQTKSPLSAALEAFVNVRGSYLKGSLASAMRRAADAATAVQSGSVHGVREGTIEYPRGSARFGEWFAAMYGMVYTEQQVLTNLVRGTSIESAFEDMWTAILQPLVVAVSDLIPTLLPRLHHGLNAHRMVALDFISASVAVFGADGRKWTTLLKRGESPNKDLSEAMVNSQRDALLFFPEFIRDVKIIPVQRDSSAIQSGVNDVAILGVRLIKELGGYADVVFPLLDTLGTKNWKSSGVPYGTQSENAAQRLYDEYVVDLLASVVVSLERACVLTWHYLCHFTAYRIGSLPVEVRICLLTVIFPIYRRSLWRLVHFHQTRTQCVSSSLHRLSAERELRISRRGKPSCIRLSTIPAFRETAQ